MIEDLQKVYDDLFEYNLPNLLKYMDCEFHTPSDLRSWLHIDDPDNKWLFDENPYLHDTNSNRKVLGQDILDNGMYWAFMIIEDEMRVAEGKHRITALNEFDIPKSTKYLCIAAKYIYYSRQHDDIINDVYYKLHPDFVDLYTELKYVDNNDQQLVAIPSFMYLIQYWNHYITWLNVQIFEHHKAGKPRIIPSPIVNSEDAYDKWYNEKKDDIQRVYE